MGRSQREKGKLGEREAVHLIREIFGIDSAHRTAQRCGKLGMADVQAVPGLHIEVKRRRGIHCEAFLKQAETDALAGEVPVVLMRGDKSPRWMVLLEARTVLPAIERLAAAMAVAKASSVEVGSCAAVCGGSTGPGRGEE